MGLKTALYEKHLEHQGKMVDFAGYQLPIQYPTGVIEEHKAVRERCGLFDVSHMGEIIVSGKQALVYLNQLLSNDFSTLVDGQARYSLMLNDEGGIVDDLIVYKIKEEHYFIVVNAANRSKDYAWMQTKIIDEVKLDDISDKVAQLAIQGPLAKTILLKVCEEEMLPIKYYSANFNGNIKLMPCVISKTGYTGEDGYELYCDHKDAQALWDLLIDAGQQVGLIPCGLAARDTLRLEAAMPLYGHEMSDSITPLEAKLSSFVKMDKEEFVGKNALIEKGEPKKIRVGLKVLGRGILRENMPLYYEGKEVGTITSGTHAPYLGYPVAMAYVAVAQSTINSVVYADVRGRRVEAEVVALPFYKKKKI